MPSPAEAEAAGRGCGRGDFLPPVAGLTNRHCRPSPNLALSPEFSRPSFRLPGLWPNLNLVQLSLIPSRSQAGASRPPGLTPRFAPVASFPSACHWGAAGAGSFLRKGFLPNQFKFSPPSSRQGELESCRPSPCGWRKSGPGLGGGGDVPGDQLQTSERGGWTSDPRGERSFGPGVLAFVLPSPNHKIRRKSSRRSPQNRPALGAQSAAWRGQGGAGAGTAGPPRV